MRTIRNSVVLAAFTLTTACAGNPSEAQPGASGSDDGTGGWDTDTEGDPTNATGTSIGSGSATAGTTGAPEDVAQIRFVHAAAGGPSLDIYVAGAAEPLVTDLAYGAASGYLEVPLADLALEIRAAGASADEPAAYTTGALDIAADAVVTAVAAGILDSADEDTALRLLPLVEAFEAPGAGRAAVRIVNAGTDAPSVNADVGEGPELVDRFADSGAAGVTMPAATALQLAVASGARDTVFTTPTLVAGDDVFVITAGELGAVPRATTGLGLIVLARQGVIAQVRQNPVLYSLHAVADSGPLDVCIDGELRVAGATFDDLTRIQLPPGTYDLDYFIGATDCTREPASQQSSGELVAGQQYLMVAAGEVIPEVGNPDFTVTRFVEEFPLDAGPSAVLALIHAASAPNLDLGTLVDGQVTLDTLLVSDLAYAEVSDFVVLPAADYELGIVPASMPLPAPPYGPIPMSMAAGTRSWTVAVGDVSPAGFDQIATLFTVVTSENPWDVMPL